MQVMSHASHNSSMHAHGASQPVKHKLLGPTKRSPPKQLAASSACLHSQLFHPSPPDKGR